MIINIILGDNIDTEMWINSLKKNQGNHIIVIDYDYYDEFEERNGVTYMSPMYAQKYKVRFKERYYYKSMYIPPGMYDIRPSSLNG